MGLGTLSRYPEQESVGKALDHPLSIRENLRRRQKHLQEELDKTTTALDALDSQPEVAELLEKIMKVI